jgi:hypothetical protein
MVVLSFPSQSLYPHPSNWPVRTHLLQPASSAHAPPRWRCPSARWPLHCHQNHTDRTCDPVMTADTKTFDSIGIL